MPQIPTFELIVGATAPTVGLFVRENGTLLTGLDSGHTFALKVVDEPGGTTAFTKTSGITGQAGSGLPPDGTPNVTIQWATSGEVASLTGGERYLAELTITRTADSRKRIRQFYLQVIPAA